MLIASVCSDRSWSFVRPARILQANVLPQVWGVESWLLILLSISCDSLMGCPRLMQNNSYRYELLRRIWEGLESLHETHDDIIAKCPRAPLWHLPDHCPVACDCFERIYPPIAVASAFHIPVMAAKDQREGDVKGPKESQYEISIVWLCMLCIWRMKTSMLCWISS